MLQGALIEDAWPSNLLLMKLASHNASRKPLNVIDLHVKEMKSVQYQPPEFVTDISLGHLYASDMRRDVQENLNFCLVTQAGAITEWHVDFSHTSVFYFIVKGQKEFVIANGNPAVWSALDNWETRGNRFVLTNSVDFFKLSFEF